MINNEKNIDIIVSALKAHNIRHIVISPGGTNICFVRKVQKDSFFKCYSVVDERSAMYVAIGIYLQTEEIVATSCTSAQATRNYIPGLTEAYYKRVPILALTMEKHTRFKYQEYMQAPDQTSLPKDCVKASYELPAIADENDILFSNRLVNEAILELNHNGYGPVQLCIPWLDFQLSRNDINYRYINNFSERKDGYHRELRRNGLHIPTEHEYKLTPTVDGAYSEMKEILSHDPVMPTAFFADNDIIALSAMRALKEKGYRIPEDISIIGIDDMPMCELMDPPLTTMHVPKHQMGVQAVKRLLEKINSNSREILTIEIRTSLVERQSIRTVKG